jgi:hypothetical protein
VTGSLKYPDLARVRFFVDEDLAGVGLAMMRLRNDVVVGSHDPVKDFVPHKDRDWIPVVAARGWVTITNDRRIRTRFDEASAALEYELRVVHLAPPVRDATRWDFVCLLARHWEAVEELTTQSGPAWLALRKGGAPPSWSTSLVSHLGSLQRQWPEFRACLYRSESH